MPNINIDAFKAKLTGGGARPNLFRVLVNFPSFAEGDTELTSFMAKGASIPPSVLGIVEVPFRGGRKLKVAGDRTFDPITLTITNDTNFAVRNAFERWSNGINSHLENVGAELPADYFSDVTVEQLDKNGDVIKTYDIVDAWPSNLSEIDLNFETNDTIEEFTVELNYQYWNSDTTT